MAPPDDSLKRTTGVRMRKAGASKDASSTAASSGKSSRKDRLISRAEVARHNKKGDVWLIIGKGVYDISKWVPYHPGGDLPIIDMAGQDCSDVFTAFHPPWVAERKLEAFRKGTVADDEESELMKDFRALRARLVAEGKFKPNLLWFAAKQAFNLSLLAASVSCVLFGSCMLTYVVGAVLMAAFWQQLAFIGHDSGHNGITGNRTVDTWIGMLSGNLLGGVSIGWWKRTHNVHHIMTNSMEYDPDIQHLPAMAISEEILKPYKSLYHHKVFLFDSISKLLVSYQHWLFYPIMGVARVNLYAQSYILLLSKVHMEHRKKELFFCFAFLVWYGALLAQLPTSGARWAFFGISHFLSGFLHVQICISHFAQPIHHGTKMDDSLPDTDDFLIKQLETTLDVDTEWYDHWVHGGLQWQTEHHLFPRMPRHHLGYTRKLLRAFCKKHNLVYNTAGFVECNRRVISTLYKAALRARELPPDTNWTEEFSNSMLMGGLNAEG